MTIEDCDKLIARTYSTNPDFDLSEIRALAQTLKDVLETKAIEQTAKVNTDEPATNP